jgi:hypothetical protein
VQGPAAEEPLPVALGEDVEAEVEPDARDDDIDLAEFEGLAPAEAAE